MADVNGKWSKKDRKKFFGVAGTDFWSFLTGDLW
jgi:hypothetical protein